MGNHLFICCRPLSVLFYLRRNKKCSCPSRRLTPDWDKSLHSCGATQFDRENLLCPLNPYAMLRNPLVTAEILPSGATGRHSRFSSCPHESIPFGIPPPRFHLPRLSVRGIVWMMSFAQRYSSHSAVYSLSLLYAMTGDFVNSILKKQYIVKYLCPAKGDSLDPQGRYCVPNSLPLLQENLPFFPARIGQAVVFAHRSAGEVALVPLDQLISRSRA